MKECSYDELTDAFEDKTQEGTMVVGYPFAFVLRMRVVQIVCGISMLVMGAVALIEEKNQLNLGFGIPAGLSTVLAAGQLHNFIKIKDCLIKTKVIPEQCYHYLKCS